MSEKIYSFKSKLELAEYLGISRPTLNSRLAKLNVKEDVKLEAPFTFTAVQLDDLKSDQRESKSSKKIAFSLDNSQTEPGSNDKIKLLEHELHAQQEKLIEIQNLRIDEYKEHGQTIVNLTNKMVKIQDQAQQLQLDLQTKLNHSEQERLALLDTANKSTNSDEYLHELKENIAELKEQISDEKQAKESLQTKLKNSEHFSDYLFRENQQLDDLKEELTNTLATLEDKQQHLNTLQQELNETQGIAQEKTKQRQYIAEENKTLREQLTETKRELQAEQNKSFWQRLFGR